MATKADKPGLCPALAPVVANPLDAGLDLAVVLQPLDLNGTLKAMWVFGAQEQKNGIMLYSEVMRQQRVSI